MPCTSLRITFLLTDTLGSVVSSINNVSGSASVQGNQAYSPYGTTTGLDDYGARYYDPVVGRFVTPDVVQGNGDGLDPYAYVGGNPETNTDPTGQSDIEQGSEGAVQMVEAPPPDGTGDVAPPDGTGDSGGGGGIGSIPLIGFAIAWIHSVFSGNASSSPAPATVSSGPDIHYGPVLNSVSWYAYRHQHPSSPAAGGATSPSGGATSPSGGATSPSGGATSPSGGGAGGTTWDWPTTSPRTQTAGGGMRPPGPSQPVAAPGDACSFTPETQVSTAQGKQDIGSLQVGDKVWAYNPKTKQMELQPIEHVWINHDNDLVDLTLTTTTHAPHSTETTKVNEVIHTNKKHPFLTEEKGFVPVRQLKLGMHVREADEQYGVITDWKLKPGTQTMYNLEVAQDHTFTVGNEQWVVHNCGGDVPTGNSSEDDPPSGPATNVGATSDPHAGSYWRESSLNDAPTQTSPGTRFLQGVHINDLGIAEPWDAYYDEYGRLIGRTDYALGDMMQGIEPTHYHVYSYTEFSSGFKDNAMPFGDHIPGEFDPLDWLAGWEFLL